MRIGIVGSGLMGAALGRLWARAGHEVVFSYARDPRRLAALAESAGDGAHAGSVRDAVSVSDAVLLAVRWSSIDDVLAQAGPLRDRVVLSCVLPMTDDDAELTIGRDWSGAEELVRRAPGVRLVPCFNTVPSELLTAMLQGHALHEGRPAVVYCDDDPPAGEMGAALIRDAGCDPVYAGALRVARYVEPFGLLMGQLAYERGLGPALGYRLAALPGDDE